MTPSTSYRELMEFVLMVKSVCEHSRKYAHPAHGVGGLSLLEARALELLGTAPKRLTVYRDLARCQTHIVINDEDLFRLGWKR